MNRNWKKVPTLTPIRVKATPLQLNPGLKESNPTPSKKASTLELTPAPELELPISYL